MPRRAAAAQPNRRLKIFAWIAGSIIVLAAVGLLLGQTWLNRYLRSPEFRKKMESKVGQNMRAQVAIAPIRFDGTQFFCEDFRAQGIKEASFSLAKAEDVRGEVSLPSIFGVIFGKSRFRVPNVEVQRLTLELYDADKLDLVLPPKERPKDRSAMENLHIRDVRVAWRGGGLNGVAVHATPVDGGWRIEGTGGRVVQLGLPPIDLVNARILRKDRTVFVQDARLRHKGGELSGTGEIVSDDKADLQLKLTNFDVGPLLTEDWRAKLHGQLFGDLRVRIPLNTPGRIAPTVTGKLRLEKGVLEALPILNKIADYLRTDQFRRVELSQASADIHYDAKGLRIENLVLESKQLIALRGGFTLAEGQVNGVFELGVTPGPLQWLPGSQEKVFTVERDGYVWAPLRVTGPMTALKEDLSPRLIAAARGAIVEKVENTATQAVDSAVDSAKRGASGVLDLLFGN